MYNVPGRTGSTVSAETTLRIAQLPNIVATKEATGSLDICMDIVTGKSDDFGVISGEDGYTLPFIAAGMQGVISVIGNAYPKELLSNTNCGIEFVEPDDPQGIANYVREFTRLSGTERKILCGWARRTYEEYFSKECITSLLKDALSKITL